MKIEEFLEIHGLVSVEKDANAFTATVETVSFVPNCGCCPKEYESVSETAGTVELALGRLHLKLSSKCLKKGHRISYGNTVWFDSGSEFGYFHRCFDCGNTVNYEESVKLVSDE